MPISLDLLIPYARNARTHSAKQISQIAASIREFGFVNPVLIKTDMTIIAGHGRVQAAQQLSMKQVPCLILDHLTEVQAKALAIADNKIPLNAGWDAEMLTLEIDELKFAGTEMDLLAFDDDELKSIIDSVAGKAEEDEVYTSKIIAPVYEPKGEKPSVGQLFNETKTKELIEEIEQYSLPEEVASFLKTAAHRHTVFNFRNIAEFYAHTQEEVKRLFEKSALVIIDYNSAIENGFVHLTERLAELADSEDENEAEL